MTRSDGDRARDALDHLDVLHRHLARADLADETELERALRDSLQQEA